MNKLFIKPCEKYDSGIYEFKELRGKIVEGICYQQRNMFRVYRQCAPERYDDGRWWSLTGKSHCMVLDDESYKKLKSIGIEEIDRNTNL
jgi:hypothetical protein